MNSTTAQVHPRLVDDLMELYCNWRTECWEVRATWARFLEAEPSDRVLAFAAYTAALDREASASEAYASQVRLITTCIAADSCLQVLGGDLRPRG